MNPTLKLNDIRTLTATAERLGVTLPENINTQATHLAALETERHTRADLSPAQHATKLAAHLGNPAAMRKARANAVADVAAANVDTTIAAHLLDRCAAVLHQSIRQNGDAIVAAFAPAVAAAIDTLNDVAGRLPREFKPDNAAEMTPNDFATWTQARTAHALLESLHGPLRILYTTPASGLLTPDAVRALRYVEPPALNDAGEAGTFARALAGIRHAGSAVGPVNLDGVFAPTAVAHLGGTFAWATPTEVEQRAHRLHAAAVAA